MADDEKNNESSDESIDESAGEQNAGSESDAEQSLDMIDEDFEDAFNAMAEELGHDPEQLSKHFGFSVKEAFSRGFSYSDVLYLLDQCPYLQIIDGVGKAKPWDEMRIDQSASGWLIHNYGDALTSSPGRLIFGIGAGLGSLSEDEDEGGSGGVSLSTVGTVVNQSYITVRDMIALAIAQGWGHVKLVDGHPRLFRYAWVEAMSQGIAIEGFKPTDQDRQFQERIQSSSVELISRISKSSPRD